ncbi:MAG: cyclic nucleotide-binding domain-containing protein [Burkholderiales bacterium]|nr:cyclic nucleotide-binding domain-containing protein [Burkholderiales bacterium]
MRSKIADLLDEIELFQDFTYTELEIISRYLRLEEADAQATIFKEGERGNYMVILLTGRIGIYKGGVRHLQLLSQEGRGRIVGEMSLLDHELRSATCIAELDCEFLTMTQDSLKKLALEQPAVAYHFMLHLARFLSKRLRRVSGMMADFMSAQEEQDEADEEESEESDE